MRRAIPLLVAAACLLPVTPAAAGTVVEKLWVRGGADLSLSGSNGYLIAVERSDRTVSLIASRGGEFLSFAVYTVRGGRSPGRIDANFGRFGRVSVRFEPKRARKLGPRKGCKGKRALHRLGVFTGTIEFRGEDGYTTVDVSRAQGRVTDSIRETCRYSQLRAGGKQVDSLFGPPTLAVQGGGRGFGATIDTGPRGSESAQFSATTRERRGRIGIYRSVFAAGPPKTFLAVDDLSSAVVDPPPPFQGEAAFQREHRGMGAWLGPLSVSFPGRNDVRLAGPRFQARLAPGD